MSETNKFTIEVEIGEDTTSHANLWEHPAYKVYINPKEVSDEMGLHSDKHLINVVAHEIGHVLGHRFGLKNAAMTNHMLVPQYHYNEEFAMGVEREAWDIAEMMVLKNKALRAHRSRFTKSWDLVVVS